MDYPPPFHRVRMNGRDGEFAIVRIDHSSSEVDLCSVSGTAEIERSVPLDLLRSAPEYVPAQFDVNTREMLAAVSRSMECCRAQIAGSHAAIATLRDLISTTMGSIRTSQLLILESDRIIARSWTFSGQSTD